MKRYLLLLLALALLVPAGLAESGKLDAAFAGGALNLAPVPFGPLEAAQSVTVPDGFIAYAGLEGVTAESLAADILARKAEIRILDISPDGGAAIGELDNIPLAVSGGAMHVLFPTAESLAADEYGNLARMLKHNLARYLGVEGSAWSPDGRYAIPQSSTIPLRRGDLTLDPMIIDAQTGDVRVLATYPARRNDGNIAAPVAAAFSPDGSTAYFMMLGNAFGGKGALLRADLKSGEVATCFAYPEYPDYLPRLSILSDGRLVALPENITKNTCQALAVYEPLADQLMRLPCYFSEPIPFVNCTNLRVSDRTDRGIAYGYTGLISLRFGRTVEGLDNRWGLELSSGALVRLSAGDLSATDFLYDSEVMRAAMSVANLPRPEKRYATILAAALSPDGNYALAVFIAADDVAALLIRLEDMAAVPVNGLDALPKSPVSTRLIWSEAGILATLEDNSVQLFGIQE